MDEGLVNVLRNGTPLELARFLGQAQGFIPSVIINKLVVACFYDHVGCVQWLRDNTSHETFAYMVNEWSEKRMDALNLVSLWKPSAPVIFRILLRAGASPGHRLRDSMKTYADLGPMAFACVRLLIDYGGRVGPSSLYDSVNIDTLSYATDYQARVTHALFCAHMVKTHLPLPRDLRTYVGRWVWRMR